MPFTVFHWGYAYLAGELFLSGNRKKARVQLIALLAATIPDFEGFLHVLGFQKIPIHGPLHSIFSSIVIGLVLLGFAFFIQKKFSDTPVTEDEYLTRYLKWEINLPEKIYIILSPLIFHLALDVWMYQDLQLFWPFARITNQLESDAGSLVITNLSVLVLFIAIIWFIFTVVKSMLKHLNLTGFEPQ